jgi:hypothetical protein
MSNQVLVTMANYLQTILKVLPSRITDTTITPAAKYHFSVLNEGMIGGITTFFIFLS